MQLHIKNVCLIFYLPIFSAQMSCLTSIFPCYFIFFFAPHLYFLSLLFPLQLILYCVLKVHFSLSPS